MQEYESDNCDSEDLCPEVVFPSLVVGVRTSRVCGVSCIVDDALKTNSLL